MNGVQEQLWAAEDADTQREALEARLAASEAECQQLHADLAAAQHSVYGVRSLSLRFQHSVWNVQYMTLQQAMLLVRSFDKA